jgi:predicted metal-binding membrane protein
MHVSTNPAPPTANAVPRRSAIFVLSLAIVLAWVYLAWMAWGMQHMDAQLILMPAMNDWGAVDLSLVWVMWALMMAGMMLPSAAPMLLAFQALSGRVNPVRPASHALAFAGGYLAVWAAFSAAASLMQWGLLQLRLVSPMMVATSAWLAGALLCLAGTYQFTRLKAACLGTCQSPLVFLVRQWRPGLRGAWAMGWRHGWVCLGCCWALMALLFVLGVMNLWWIIALTLLVLAEKALPAASWLPLASGAALLAWGLWLVLRTAV